MPLKESHASAYRVNRIELLRLNFGVTVGIANCQTQSLFVVHNDSLVNNLDTSTVFRRATAALNCSIGAVNRRLYQSPIVARRLGTPKMAKPGRSPKRSHLFLVIQHGVCSSSPSPMGLGIQRPLAGLVSQAEVTSPSQYQILGGDRHKFCFAAPQQLH